MTLFVVTVGDCHALPNPPNGNIRTENIENYTIALLSCNNGYEVVGQKVSVCANETGWQDAIGECLLTQQSK